MVRSIVITLRALALLVVMLAFANSLRSSGLSLGHHVTLLPGFRERLIAGQLERPASIAPAPDGRIFLVGQTGNIRIVENDRLLSEPFLVLDTLATVGEGMFHVAFDPDFETNQWVYVYYLAPGRSDRLVRVTADGNRAVPGSMVTIWDSGPLSNRIAHHGGSPVFDADGFIYFGTGDTDVGENAQLLDSPNGKVMRITREGAPAPGNPFLNTPHALPEIFAYGFRNPYSLAYDTVTDTMLVADVGQVRVEEINRLVSGGNYGWGVCEGPCDPPRADMLDSLLTYAHGLGDDAGCAIIGGAFYHPLTPRFPVKYLDNYFYADLCNGWIRTLNLKDKTSTLFATGLVHPEDVKVGADGALYYLSRGVSNDFYASPSPGQLWRIEYVAPETQ